MPPSRALLALPVALVVAAAPLRAAADPVVVFAAAALSGALDRVAKAWMAETGHRVVTSFAGSSALARQIQAGAPADVFVSASVEWMDAVAAAGDLRAGTRRDLLATDLVLIAHGGDAAPVTIDADLDLAGLLGGGRLSMSLVDAVPSGIYGRQALQSLALWDAVAPSVAQSDNVRTALAFVARGEAPLGIVYAADAVAEDRVSVLGTFPAESHAPIVFPAALTAEAGSPAAAAFLEFLSTDAAWDIWAQAGFRRPP